MILIGENLNFMSQDIGLALKGKAIEPIREMARKEDLADVDYLNLSVGSSENEVMAWLVNTVQSITQKPLSLEANKPAVIESGLQACQNKPLINSISLNPENLQAELPLVNKYDAEMIGILRGMDGMPQDALERCVLAVDLVYKANQYGIPSEKIWIDPVARPVLGEIDQLKATFGFLSLISEVCPGCKSIVVLSDVSRGMPPDLKPYLDRTYLMMLMKYGLSAAFVDVFDTELIDVAKGRRPELVNLVHAMMDGEMPDLTSLSQEEIRYIKMVRMINGESLFSAHGISLTRC